MTDEELHALIASLRRSGTDLAGVEVKRGRGGVPTTLVESLSAFSNSPGGGVLVLGLDDKERFASVGIVDPPTMLRKVQGLCADSMEPPLRPLLELHQFEGADLLVIEIPELSADQKPCFYKGTGRHHGSYVRVGDGDHRMTPYEVQQLIASRGQPTDDTELIPGATLDDLDPTAISALLSRARASKPTFTPDDDLTVLRRLRVLAPHPRDEGRIAPTLGGLLCLGRHPQDFLPQLNVTFVHYPGPGSTAENLRFVDSRALDGPIPVVIRDALVLIKANMGRRSAMRGAGREDAWEYPEEALREAIVNAVLHRDYSASARGSQVQIEMYSDRLVVRSPGGLFGPATADRLGEAGVSSTRNATLVRLLEDTTLPGEQGAVCENRGSGIPAMIRVLRAAGLSLPRFEDKLSCFDVTFENHALLDDTALHWLAGLGQDGLSSSQAEGLGLMRQGASFTNATYRNRFLLDSRVATAELGDLVRRGLVDVEGTRRWTTYWIDDRLAAIGPPPSEVLTQDGPRRVLLALADGAERSKAEIASHLRAKERTVLDWLGKLRSANPALVDRVGPARSPSTRYRISSPGAAALETLRPTEPRLFD